MVAAVLLPARKGIATMNQIFIAVLVFVGQNGQMSTDASNHFSNLVACQLFGTNLVEELNQIHANIVVAPLCTPAVDVIPQKPGVSTAH